MTFFRYLLVQVAAYAIDMGTFLVILNAGILSPFTSNALAKLAAGIFAYLNHQFFTFHVPDGARGLRQALRYTLLLSLNLSLSSCVLATFMLITEQAVTAKFATDIVCVLLTFWISQKWVFVARLAYPRIEQ